MSVKSFVLKEYILKFLKLEANNVIEIDQIKGMSKAILDFCFSFRYPKLYGEMKKKKLISPPFQLTKLKNNHFFVLSTKVYLPPQILNMAVTSGKMDIIMYKWKDIILTEGFEYIMDNKFQLDLLCRIYLSRSGRITEEKLYFNLRKMFYTGMKLFLELSNIIGLKMKENGDLSSSLDHKNPQFYT